VQVKTQSVGLLTTEPNFVAIPEGENVTLVCRAISPITSCSFILPGESSEIKLIPNETRRDSNYDYFGDGFTSGQCGIFIANVKKENNGNAACIVDLNEHLSGIKANISIIITKELPKGT
jgi:hypothetical protein